MPDLREQRGSGIRLSEARLAPQARDVRLSTLRVQSRTSARTTDALAVEKSWFILGQFGDVLNITRTDKELIPVPEPDHPNPSFTIHADDCGNGDAVKCGGLGHGNQIIRHCDSRTGLAYSHK